MRLKVLMSEFGHRRRSGERMRVLICGGGVIGASIAYFLSCRGVQSIVIERTRLACAASGKARLSPPAAIVHYSGGTRALSQDAQGKLAFVEKETR
jgi:glycine/D-amino acid oxidase-like deaminating enzyme